MLCYVSTTGAIWWSFNWNNIWPYDVSTFIICLFTPPHTILYIEHLRVQEKNWNMKENNKIDNNLPWKAINHFSFSYNRGTKYNMQLHFSAVYNIFFLYVYYILNEMKNDAWISLFSMLLLIFTIFFLFAIGLS